MITIEEVQHCLDELDETIDSQKQVDKVIGTSSSYLVFVSYKYVSSTTC